MVSFLSSGPTLTESDIIELERNLGYTLPAQLREFYLRHNGGYTKENIYIDEEGDDYEIQNFLQIGTGETSLPETIKRLTGQRHLLKPDMVPFARESGGNLYCISLDSGAVWVWSAEDVEDSTDAYSLIANSLNEFISGLVTAEEAY